MSKNILKWKIKAKLKIEKNLKNLLIWSLHSLIVDYVAYELTKTLIQPHSPVLVGEVEHIVGKHVGTFLGLGSPGDERVWERKKVVDERL